MQIMVLQASRMKDGSKEYIITSTFGQIRDLIYALTRNIHVLIRISNPAVQNICTLNVSKISTLMSKKLAAFSLVNHSLQCNGNTTAAVLSSVRFTTTHELTCLGNTAKNRNILHPALERA